jgi:16S rRNA (guanine527-N7)-methyltransferase
MTNFTETYLDLLKEHFTGLNLTRITEKEDFHNLQYIDSIAPFKEIPELAEMMKKTQYYVDIGFGGGFPLLPLAYLYPSVNFWGFEARNKKAVAVQSIANFMELKNVKAMHQRFENVNLDLDCLISFKAVGQIKDILSNLKGTGDLTCIFYKGPNVFDKEHVPKNCSGWTRILEFDLAIPHTEGRKILVYKFKNVPRGTFSNKRLVKLSELI